VLRRRRAALTPDIALAWSLAHACRRSWPRGSWRWTAGTAISSFELCLRRALLAHWLAPPHRNRWRDDRREDWLALVLIAIGPFAWGGRNIEAMGWIVVVVALALPWLAAGWQALRTPALDPRQAEQR
jgi:hypothetical protein